MKAGARATVQFPTSKVIIPEGRQRRKVGDLESLAEAIAVQGLINPICIHKDGRLVAGERRLRAVRDVLKWPVIDATIWENLSPVEAELVELQENVQRADLTWQEEVLATDRYHKLKTEFLAKPVKGARDGVPWTVKGTAGDLGKSEKHIKKLLRVAAALLKDDAEVQGCSTLSGAVNLLSARAERARAAATVRGLAIAGVPALPSIITAGASKEDNTKAAIAAMLAPATEEVTDEAIDLEDTSALEAALAEQMADETADPTILTGDFLSWADSYAGPKFDVLHIDFPYGKGYAGSNTRKTGRATFAPRYNDSPELYWQLVAGFLDLQDNICFSVAHCMFWFDLSHYHPTIELFREAGWELVAPHPLVWTKAYEGVASDPHYRPRHCYETALLFSKGKRRIVNLDKDHFEYSSRDPSKLHLNQKPYPMLKHFLNMLVDKNTAVLDPTCGSGMALRVARDLGSPRVFGVELDKSSAEMARFTMMKSIEELVA